VRERTILNVAAAVPSRRSPANTREETRLYSSAFTLIELIIVIGIIIVLAGLILATSGYVTKKGQRSRAEAEIAALSAALESYKADNGIYPRDAATDTLNPRGDLDPGVGPHPNTYEGASKALYGFLSGDNSNFNGVIDTPQEQANKTYFPFKPQMLGITKNPDGTTKSIDYVRDPFGNSYGYSTIYQVSPTSGFNPTFDLWSTAGTGTSTSPTPTPIPLPTPQFQWIKNW